MNKKDKKTGEQFRMQAQIKNITCWYMRDCSMCGYPLQYIFANGNAFFDSGCYCVRTQVVSPRSWDVVAEQYNSQTNSDVIKEYNKYWGFKN